MMWRPLRARAGKKETSFPGLSGFCLVAVSLLGLYCLVWPHQSGVAGTLLARGLRRAFGSGAYVLWLMLAHRGFRLLFKGERRRPWRYLGVDVLLLGATCGVLTSGGLIFLDLNWGGYLGKILAGTLTQSFGRWGAFFSLGFALSGLLLWRMGRRPAEFFVWMFARLRQDWQEWREAMKQSRELRRDPPVRKPLPKVFPRITETSTPTISAQAASAAPKKVPAAKPVIAQEPVPVADNEPPFQPPSLELLTLPDRTPRLAREEDLLSSAQLLEKTLADFGVQGKVVEIHPGPIITRYDFTPAPGIKVQAVANLANDIAMAMKALSVRILAPIPGKSAVGVELPNPNRALVRQREILESAPFQEHKSKLALGLGKDAEGHPYVSDLATMPHLLIAGSTGSGKSVCIHALIMSLMFRATPREVKFLLIDPKRLELPLYDAIPYLYDPNQNPENVRVITDAKEASKALEGMVRVMDHRFKKCASVMARDIGHYNEKMAAEGRPQEPYLVIIIDELADLMAVAPKEVEGSIQRLAQMARAVGIHLVLATQRPSVDVITGVIKANLPARLAFRVASQTDSRVILDTSGAECLLGEGDLLFLPPGAPKPVRLQCGFVTSREVQSVADYMRAQGKPSYDRVLSAMTNSATGQESTGNPEEDDLRAALLLVVERRRVSQDLLKAHFGSSARATNLLSLLEVKGFISKPEGTNRWTIYFDRIDAYLGHVKSQSPVHS